MLTISPQIPKFYIAFSLETHCCRRHTCTCATKLLHHLGTGCCLPKTTFRTKIGGGGAWLKKHPKMWDPLRISATVEASIFKFGTQLGFGTSLHHLGTGCCLPKTTFKTKIGGNGAWIHPKMRDPLRISATVEASIFKFGTQLGFGTSLPKKLFGPKLAGVWAKGSIQKS